MTLEEQCQQGITMMRDLAVRQKVALAKQLRDQLLPEHNPEQHYLLAKQLRDQLLELGHPINKGDAALLRCVPEIVEDAENGLPDFYREALYHQYQQLRDLLAHAEALEQRFKEAVRQDPVCRRLSALEGVGPVGAMLLKLALSQPGHFNNARQAAACVGVTPVQHSSGGKEKLGSISKLAGDKKLRSVLFEGALAVIRSLDKREAKTIKEQWLKQLIHRRGKKVTAIALANKTVRTAYAMLKKNTDYQPALLAG
ncbi:IS110 family transposase [Methylophaga nitratireducenticrescens]|uniref:IS110 family transposase n=1 Tax=Methylophaga nitratireducenticrescens TaxID=754476 RepID=UPI0031455C88